MRKRTKLETAILWITYEDEPRELDPLVVEDLVTVQMVSDVFGKNPKEIAETIVKYRQNILKTKG